MKILKYLMGLMALQLLVTANHFMANKEDPFDHSQRPLWAEKLGTFNKIIITGDDGFIELLNRRGKWRIIGSDILDADHNQIDTALNKLASLQVAWPVASTTSSHQRFEVSENKYRKRIQIFEDNKALRDLIIGSSPGFRKSHIRRGDQSEVYSIELNTWDFPDTIAHWMNKKLLSIDKPMAFKTLDYKIQVADNLWIYMNSPDFVVNTKKLNRLLARISDFEVKGIQTQDIERTESNTFTVYTGRKRSVAYTFSRSEGMFFVKRSDIDLLYIIKEND